MNLRKIGVMIRRYRIFKRNSSSRNDFRQDGFLISSLSHPFFDVQPGYPVCSRNTMLKLETGKTIREEELYRFFLRKLDLFYAYSPLKEQQYKACFCAFDHFVTEGTLSELETFDLPNTDTANLLYDFYDRLLSALYQFYTCALFPSIEMMDEISQLWFCVPEKIRPITSVFIVSAHSAHPFYDRIDFHPVLSRFPTHPLEILASILVAVHEEHYLLSDRLTDRYDGIGCKGELPVLLRDLIHRYTTNMHQHSSRPIEILIDDTRHPLIRLYFETMVFQLGKHAIEHNKFCTAKVYFGTLRGCGEPYGVFSALITNHPYTDKTPGNPQLKSLTDYLNLEKSIPFEKRLVILMTQVLPKMSEHEAFLWNFLRCEIVALVKSTQRYKYAFTFLNYFEPLRKNQKTPIKRRF